MVTGEGMSDSIVDGSSNSAKRWHSPSSTDYDGKQKGIFVKDPLESDVLFGRGKKALEHPGNKRMRLIIDKHAITYHLQLKAGKKRIARLVYDEVMKGGTRFLKRIDRPHGWIVVDNLAAMYKICHALRCKKNAHRLISKSEDLAKRFNIENTPLPPKSTSRASKQAGAICVERSSTSAAISSCQAILSAHKGGSTSLSLYPAVAVALPKGQAVSLSPPRNSSSDLKRTLAMTYGLGILPNPSKIMIGTQQSKLQELLLRRDLECIAARQRVPSRNALNSCFQF